MSKAHYSQKVIALLGAVLLTLTAGMVHADSRVIVDGKTYRCDNACRVSGNPPTVSDCCGGHVWILVTPPSPEPKPDPSA